MAAFSLVIVVLLVGGAIAAFFVARALLPTPAQRYDDCVAKAESQYEFERCDNILDEVP